MTLTLTFAGPSSYLCLRWCCYDVFGEDIEDAIIITAK